MTTMTYVGLDVHARTLVAAVARPGREPARVAGRIGTTIKAVDGLLERLRRQYGRELRFAQEAGPTGYWLHRHLEGRGVESVVVAPSRTARAPGERVKTDDRDACKLAEQDRAGCLTEVWVGDEAHEAMRDLVRQRSVAVRALRRERQQVMSFLLRQGRHWPRKQWTKKHRAWVAAQQFTAAEQAWLWDEMLAQVALGEARLARVASAIEQHVASWAQAPVVAALQSLRGIALINAVVLAAELGDLRRFASARALMAYLGLVPSEHSSGERIQRGPLTKTGNRRARTALTEAAWQYRWRAIAIKADQRLCQRFARLARRKLLVVAVSAVARELAGFVWAIGQVVAPAPRR